MIEIEDILIEELSEGNEVDGHDAGSDEVNIFIHTDNPKSTFDEVKTILTSNEYWDDVRVAYRELLDGEYTILWPKDLTKFKVA